MIVGHSADSIYTILNLSRRVEGFSFKSLFHTVRYLGLTEAILLVYFEGLKTSLWTELSGRSKRIRGAKPPVVTSGRQFR